MLGIRNLNLISVQSWTYLKVKEGFYKTTIALLVMLLRLNICVVILISFKERIPSNIRLTPIYVFTLFCCFTLLK